MHYFTTSHRYPQQLMADLFQTTQENISLHIKNIYAEGELPLEATYKKYLFRFEANREVQYLLDYYNLDMIISVGYRVKSPRRYRGLLREGEYVQRP